MEFIFWNALSNNVYVHGAYFALALDKEPLVRFHPTFVEGH